MPKLFIIAGPNGAGKTTYARDFLPQDMKCKEFVNADLIAAGLSPFAPERAAIMAGRLMLGRLRELAARGEDFSFETTLSGRAYAPFLSQLREQGYVIRLDFLWIPRIDLVRNRIRERVGKGGHDIPEHVQERRFHLGVRNLVGLYRPLLDHWRLLDNSEKRPVLVFEEKDGRHSISDVKRLVFIERSANVCVMPNISSSSVEEPQEITASEETRLALRALNRAYAHVVFENLRYGIPVIQYRNGKVLHTPAEQLVPLARRILEVHGDPLPDEELRDLLRGTVWDGPDDQ